MTHNNRGANAGKKNEQVPKLHTKFMLRDNYPKKIEYPPESLRNRVSRMAFLVYFGKNGYDERGIEPFFHLAQAGIRLTEIH